MITAKLGLTTAMVEARGNHWTALILGAQLII